MSGMIRGIQGDAACSMALPGSILSGDKTVEEQSCINTGDKVEISKPKEGESKNNVSKSMSEVAASIGAVIGDLKPGENIKIKIDDANNTIEAKKTREKSKTWETLTKRSTEVFNHVRAFSTELIENEPNFIFQQAVSTSKNAVENFSFVKGLPEAARNLVNVGLYPGLRVVLLCLDTKKAVSTFRDRNATKQDKLMHLGHVLTDLAGVVGGVAAMAGLAIPGVNALIATALVGDILALGYQGIRMVQGKERPKTGIEPIEGKPKEQPPKPVDPKKPIRSEALPTGDEAQKQVQETGKVEQSQEVKLPLWKRLFQ
jgi:hypothetical protein